MSIFDVAIQLPDETFRFFDRPLADGLRASTACECAACAIIQYLAPNDPRVGDFVLPGVATLGHALHQMWAHQVFAGERYEVEAAIPWEHGVSHDDVIVHTGPWAGVYECKTHSDTKPKAFSAANVRQSQFRLRLRERAGLPMPGPMRGVMIGKAGREGGMVRGPWVVELTDERRAEIDDTLERIDAILDRAATIDLDHDDELRDLANGCTRCFPKPVVPPAPGVDGLLGRYITVKRQDALLEEQRVQIVEQRKPLKDELAELRDAIDKHVPDGVVVEGMRASATRTRAGALQIKDLTADPAA